MRALSRKMEAVLRSGRPLWLCLSLWASPWGFSQLLWLRLCLLSLLPTQCRGTWLFLDDFLLYFDPSAALLLWPLRIGVFPPSTPNFLGMLIKFPLCPWLADLDSDGGLRWHLIYPEMPGCWSLLALFATTRNIWKGEGKEMTAENLRLLSLSKGCRG